MCLRQLSIALSHVKSCRFFTRLFPWQRWGIEQWPNRYIRGYRSSCSTSLTRQMSCLWDAANPVLVLLCDGSDNWPPSMQSWSCFETRYSGTIDQLTNSRCPMDDVIEIYDVSELSFRYITFSFTQVPSTAAYGWHELLQWRPPVAVPWHPLIVIFPCLSLMSN